MSGKVILIGAGPGDPGLMTQKAVRELAQAEVVLYDRLVGDGVLAMFLSACHTDDDVARTVRAAEEFAASEKRGV